MVVGLLTETNVAAFNVAYRHNKLDKHSVNSSRPTFWSRDLNLLDPKFTYNIWYLKVIIRTKFGDHVFNPFLSYSTQKHIACIHTHKCRDPRWTWCEWVISQSCSQSFVLQKRGR